MENTEGNILIINGVTITLPQWLPKQAVDPRRGPEHDEYWDMVATGSIILSEDQFNTATQFLNEIKRLLQ